MNELKQIYNKLLKAYGLQGWWPLVGHDGCNPTKTGSVNGYHPGDYSFPKDVGQRFEICVGAILTQNTGWPQVEKALVNLDKVCGISPNELLDIEEDKLKQAIKPAGYFNQKARKLKQFAEFYLELDGRIPLRDELLGVWGIGPETADSILLYAFSVPSFVVDAYTKRVLLGLGLIGDDAGYDDIKDLFESHLDKDFKIYQEYHALLVEHAKRFYSKKPYGVGDFLVGLSK